MTGRDLPTLKPRPHQIEAAAKSADAIRSEEGPALLVAPVATGKTLILVMVAVMAIVEWGYRQVIFVSRSRHVAKQTLETLRAYRPEISGGLYTGFKKQAAQILFATAPALARHLDVVEGADLVLIDECDQAYLRDETKEYSAILKTARRMAEADGWGCELAWPCHPLRCLRVQRTGGVGEASGGSISSFSICVSKGDFCSIEEPAAAIRAGARTLVHYFGSAGISSRSPLAGLKAEGKLVTSVA